MAAVPEQTTIERILSKVKDVSVLPQVVYKIIELTGDSSASAVDIERAISVDPGFSARVLQIVNSAYYALPKRVGSVKDAVLFLGFSSLRRLAMTIGAFDMFMGKTDKGSMRRRVWWRHALDTATACRALAKDFREIDPDEAHAAGLLHDIGKTILDRYGDQDYELVTQRIQAGWNQLDAEREVFGLDHCQTGMAVCNHWRFPPFLSECAGYHHVPGPDLDNPELCALVAMSSKFANMVAAKAEAQPDEAIPDWIVLAMGLTKDSIDAGFAVCQGAIVDANGLAGVLR